jgi:hypothetical protein
MMHAADMLQVAPPVRAEGIAATRIGACDDRLDAPSGFVRSGPMAEQGSGDEGFRMMAARASGRRRARIRRFTHFLLENAA